MRNTGINREMMKRAAMFLSKEAVIAAGDPALGGAPPQGGGAPPGMDPAMMGGGGAPPMDPAMMGGGAPPMPPPMPQAPPQPAMMGGGGVEPIKPKIDVNVTMLQILKILARIADALNVKIPASEMVATQGDLTSMGMQQETGAGAAMPPPAGGPQPIGPIDPSMGGASTKAGSILGLGRFGKRAMAEHTFLGK
jgi:hypothetical protein